MARIIDDETEKKLAELITNFNQGNEDYDDDNSERDRDEIGEEQDDIFREVYGIIADIMESSNSTI
jgi:hypothetical protein